MHQPGFSQNTTLNCLWLFVPFSKMRKLSLQCLSDGAKYHTGKSKTGFHPISVWLNTQAFTGASQSKRTNTERRRQWELFSSREEQITVYIANVWFCLLACREPWLRPSDLEIQLRETLLWTRAQVEDCSGDGKHSSFILETYHLGSDRYATYPNWESQGELYLV